MIAGVFWRWWCLWVSAGGGSSGVFEWALQEFEAAVFYEGMLRREFDFERRVVGGSEGTAVSSADAGF